MDILEAITKNGIEQILPEIKKGSFKMPTDRKYKCNNCGYVFIHPGQQFGQRDYCPNCKDDDFEDYAAWRVSPCPVHQGEHILHEYRYITNGDFDYNGFVNDGEIICKMTDSNKQKENAYLIAAAPDLLAALEELNAYLCYAVGDISDNEGRDVQTRVNKAIAKARKGK